jgi:hypothetical protein
MLTGSKDSTRQAEGHLGAECLSCSRGMLRADSSVVCPPRPGAVALLWLIFTGCSGTIIFGADDTPQKPDSGEAADLGGYPDAITYPDATVDAGDTGAPPCMPSYPDAWPHERTADYYWSFFGEWAATPAGGCAISSCHGNEEDALRDKPYIPEFRDRLNSAGRTTLAIDQLWEAIKPGNSTAPILHKHLETAAGGEGAAPTFYPSHVMHIEGLIQAAAMQCPTPTVTPDAGELMPDAGDPDGGPNDGSPTDRGPADI